MSTFGKFIKGIQKDKLSVDLFGGNFKLENISLNHEYFDNLSTPFKLAYSSIGKLNLQVNNHINIGATLQIVICTRRVRTRQYLCHLAVQRRLWLDLVVHPRQEIKNFQRNRRGLGILSEEDEGRKKIRRNDGPFG
jgi:hypothetical protein